MARCARRHARAPNQYGYEENPTQEVSHNHQENQNANQVADNGHEAANEPVNQDVAVNQPELPPLPPLPMNLQQFMAMQTQILQGIAQTLAGLEQGQMQSQQPQSTQASGRSKLIDYLRFHPPEFSHTVEPVEADDWLKDVERKLNQVQMYPNRENSLCGSSVKRTSRRMVGKLLHCT